ncbi:hypothetical protein GLOTRDRAFT_95011 [Gloeophyllum trabeum ATCC 11539]|uniref:Uncharacterized protein n=1 Tax=Gloeophyllum trabeum (strain ATCC 11539 / FP-39264 / Madison 617) TaxID=670483 RepID=S7PZ69_GLOTA|nr:uncharacterized protein GLOTRDRAFT_95011 [Gloeophyllum trabeum ATCC 11539]EPQ52946.1 hypothetical protein GLOTRDRAFT_95011 [Gloeophyllum trabeum ATCC 11539]
MAQGAQPAPGFDCLFTPDRFHATSSNPLPAGNWLAPGIPGSGFPFPTPPGVILPHTMALQPIRQGRLSTKPSTTKTAAAVENLLPAGQHCKAVFRSHSLWENLKQYCPGERGVLPPPPPIPYPLNHPNLPAYVVQNNGFHQGTEASQLAAQAHNHANTLGVPRLTTTTFIPNQPQFTYPLPFSEQQYHAVVELWGCFISLANRRPPVIESEPGMQDEVVVQILEILDRVMQTRYQNKVDRAPPVHQPFDHARRSFYPQWGRACAAAHRDGGPDADADSKKAGYPDFLFYRTARRYDTPAVAEIKNIWSYPNSFVDELYSARRVDRITGWIDFRRNSSSDKLIKQVWGQLVFFSASWGFWTNGDYIFIFVKTAHNHLTLSDKKHLTDSDVIRALAGMTFAAMDMDRRPWVIDWLCPYNDRQADW